MEPKYQNHTTVFALPTPDDKPYRTPPRSQSPQSQRSRSASPAMSSSPVPRHGGDDSPERRQERNHSPSNDMSGVDLRRFTPNLQASLVAEILSLRRDVESKTSDIDRLELSLHTARIENESLQVNTVDSAKETRSLKRQLNHLEGGTATSMVDLSNERDAAVSEAADLQKRLDQYQKRARLQEQSAERTHGLWERDRQNWETDRRALDTKVHVVESRLKVVLHELANYQTLHEAHQHGSPRKTHLRKGSAASLRSIGLTGRRRDSEASAGTLDGDLFGPRISTTAFLNGLPASLADELAFHELDDGEIGQGQAYPQTIREESPDTQGKYRDSRSSDWKERSKLDLSADDYPTTKSEDEFTKETGMEMRGETAAAQPTEASTKPLYVDVAVQYSPPPSPGLPPSTETFHPRTDSETFFAALETNPEIVNAGAAVHTESNMTSTSCQTTSTDLPTPPRTPITLQGLVSQVPIAKILASEMVSISTQTDIIEPVANISPSSFTVPTIAIHPPASRSTTPTGDVVLPPHTKNVSCQTDDAVVGYTSSSVQTEEIRPDTRTPQLAQSLVPIKISIPRAKGPSKKTASTPRGPSTSPRPNSSKRRSHQAGPTKAVPSRRRISKSNIEHLRRPATPENDEPISTSKSDNLTRYIEASPPPISTSMLDSLIDEASKPLDNDDIFRRPTPKFTLRAGKMVSIEESEPNYHDIFAKIDADAKEREMAIVEEDQHGESSTSRSGKPQEPGAATRHTDRRHKTLRTSSSRQFDIRKAALISSGTAAHQSAQSSQPAGKTRAPSPTATANPPPFPVPTRHSSRNPPLSLSEGAQSPTPRSRSPRKKDGKVRKMPLRKARSAANVNGQKASGHRRTPSPSSIGSHNDNSVFSGISLPPMPPVPIFTPPGLDYATSHTVHDPIAAETRSRAESASSVPDQTSVIDAIAQTMVGEWMFKYVRRRKSFGVPEPKSQDWDLSKNGEELSATITNTGIRHKRWVWLAPYEKSVMWSSKQPTSGSALMGKTGRKLEIQSVLDVRDDNALPKGSGLGPHFCRSILILTPQRALKFTALTLERHFVWLTALSFLSHSPLGLGDLHAISGAPQPPELPVEKPLGGSLRRNPIRDSIRVAKGRDLKNFGQTGGPRSFTANDYIPECSNQMGADDMYDVDIDAADPPTIPRYHTHHVHTRKRSNTAPRLPPPISYRNISPQSSAPPPSSTYSMTTASVSDVYTPSTYNGHGGVPSVRSTFGSRRGSEASGSVPNSGYFEHNYAGYQAGGAPTRRMEAFIAEEGSKGSVVSAGGSVSGTGSYRTRQGRKKDLGYWGAANAMGSGERGALPMPSMIMDGTTDSRPRSPTAHGAYPGFHADGHSAGVTERERDHGAYESRRYVGLDHFRGF